MWLKVINWFIILEVYNLIGLGFSSTFLKFGNKDMKEYSRLKSANVHRGVLFTWSPAQKHEVCKDVFSAQIYINSITKAESSEEKSKKMAISDSIESMQRGGKPEYPLFRRRIVETPWSEPEWSFGFKCFGQNFQKRSPTPKPYNWFHLHYAFYPKWLYYAHKIVSIEENFSLWNFITLSPDYVEQNQAELEKNYVSTQVKLMALREESSEYVEQVKRRVDLLNLTKLQRFILCASILSSPIYRKDRLEFSFDWMDTTPNTLKYETKELSLMKTIHPKEKLTADCIPCQAYKDGTDLTSENETLYITPAYDNQYSAIVLMEIDGVIYLDKYFTNIAVLITLHEEMNYVELLSNFPRPKLSN